MSGRNVSLVEGFDYIALRLFNTIAPIFAKTFELDRSIKRAGLTIHPYLYAARVLLATTIAFLLALYTLIIVILSSITLTAKILASLILLTLPVFVLAAGLSYPSLKADERRRRVESELPFLASYLSAMAIAGVDVISALERIASLRVFDGIRREAQLIMRDVKLLGRNPLDAIEANASDHPSSHYRDFMLGYSAAVKIGGNVIGYLEAKTTDIFKSRIEELKVISERLSLYTELYIILAVIVSISFYTFLAINAMFSGSPGGGVVEILLFSFIFLPLSNLLILFLADRAYPKTPVRIATPYMMILSYGVPSALIATPLVFYATGAYRALGGEVNSTTIIASMITFSTPLVAISLPGAYAWIAESRRLKGMGDSIASFLRDLVEVRKTGLSPEKSIVVLSSRDYGPLTPVIRRIASSLLLGLDMEQAVKSALRGYRNWILLASMRLLTDTITLGGGSVEALESLARYARGIADFEVELKRRLRIYMLMPYLGALMVSGSSMLILAYIAQTISMSHTGAQVASIVGPIALVISLGVTLNSWIMGLVAGKLSNGTVLAGFTHSTILMFMSMVTIALTLRTMTGIL